MTKILISLNGDCTAEKDQLREDYDLIFGVDGGTEYLYKLFLVPTHIIGDFDSIKEATKKAYFNMTLSDYIHIEEILAEAVGVLFLVAEA